MCSSKQNEINAVSVQALQYPRGNIGYRILRQSIEKGREAIFNFKGGDLSRRSLRRHPRITTDNTKILKSSLFSGLHQPMSG